MNKKALQPYLVDLDLKVANIYSLIILVLFTILTLSMLSGNKAHAAENCTNNQLDQLKSIVSEEYGDTIVDNGNYVQTDKLDGSYDSNSYLYYQTESDDITTADIKKNFDHPRCRELTNSNKYYTSIKNEMECKMIKKPYSYYNTVCTIKKYKSYCSSNNTCAQGYELDNDTTELNCDKVVDESGNSVEDIDEYIKESVDSNGNLSSVPTYYTKKPIYKYKIVSKKFKVTDYKDEKVCWTVVKIPTCKNNRCSGNSNDSVPFGSIYNALPTRGKTYNQIPSNIKNAVNKIGSLSYAIGDELNNNNRSIHFYLPNSTAGKCAILFSENKDGKLISWGAEKIGKHAANLSNGSAGQKAFVPSSEKDAYYGYHVFVLNSKNGLLYYKRTNINW